MELMNGRIHLDPRPQNERPPALEVAMLGHCPGRVRLDRLSNAALTELRRIGYGQVYEELIEEITKAGSGVVDIEEGGPTEALHKLYHLPIALHSLAEFNDIFPDARFESTDYKSLIAGDLAWLPQAVEDFFANGGERLWLIHIPQQAGQAGFLPTVPIKLHYVESLRGLAVVLAIHEVGLVALPDLERISIPEDTQDIPRVRLENPEPEFLPCTTNLDDDHRERRNSEEIPEPSEHYPFANIITAISDTLNRYRPDMQCLFTMPLHYTEQSGKPIIDKLAIHALDQIKQGSKGPQLKRIQFLYPYMRSLRYRLVSGVGLVAGAQANVAKISGIWRSMAGKSMLTDAHPYPYVTTFQGAQLREAPGIGVLLAVKGKVMLDDERLTMPALHPGDYRLNEAGKYKGYRSGEVARFIGYLQRQLRGFGEMLIFNVDSRDPRPRFILEEFFQRLHDLGALRGGLHEEAFEIRQRSLNDETIAFDIEIAPTFPIDKFHLTFTNRTGEWQAEIVNG